MDRSRAEGSESVGIRMVGVEKYYGTVEAVKNLNLEAPNGELLVLLGPSGCGKTTTLNLLAGLEMPTRGEIYFGDQSVSGVPTEHRNIGMVFQTSALYPHMNALANITYALRTKKVRAETIEERVRQVVGLLGIEDLLGRRLTTLSGGERQRVAIAKALVKRPKLFLLDEPFSNLDAEMRRFFRAELVRIHRELATTMVFVTHDQEEAMAIATRIAVMRDGELIQLDSPLNIYDEPRNLWISRFIGSHPINIFPLELEGEGERAVAFEEDRVPLQLGEALRAKIRDTELPKQVLLGLRPEFITLEDHPGPDTAFSAEVFAFQVLGTQILYHMQVNGNRLHVVAPAHQRYDHGAKVGLRFAWERVFLFNPSTEDRIV